MFYKPIRRQPLLKWEKYGSPSGPLVKNPLDIARDTGSIPAPGRFHMSRGN